MKASHIMIHDSDGEWELDGNNLDYTNINTGEKCRKTGKISPREGFFVENIETMPED
jgi:hypothetical protein